MEGSPSYYFTLVVSICVILCFSAFFSACEMAFSSLNRIKLKNLAEKRKSARLALKMLESYDKLLSSVLIGNNISNIASSTLATALFIGLFGVNGVSIATLIMTVLLMLFCDISPKALAKETPEMAAIRVAPLLSFFVFIFTPINLLTVAWKKLLMKIFPVKHNRSTTEDELLTFVGEVREEGGINVNEEKMIRQVISFDELKVSGIYTPRIDVAAVSIASSVEEIDRLFIKTGFSRLPVFQDTIDNIKGIIILKDFYHQVMKGQKIPSEIIKPVVYVTKTIKIAKLLRTMQEKQAYMAVVIDEYGGTLGIATIEDIVEELVGEIWDEHDKVVEPVKKGDDGSYTVLGNVNFRDMLEIITGKTFNNEEIPDTTVANWFMENLGRLPVPGEVLSWHYLTITVLKVIKHRVMEVKVTANFKIENIDE
ncbi:MAG: hemolysin family protein [Spirochaetes bacterium]|nr:hemolysin family protein [Brevinematales bacterium]MCL1959525.1 hemolysin family protein [Spirochaetota bacterium]